MSHMSHTPFMDAGSNDYHRLPVTDRQLAYARQIAARAELDIPEDAQSDRRTLSAWIDAHRPQKRLAGEFSNYPSSKQVAFAERIARIKRRHVPQECFRDRLMMSRWIDCNL